MQFEFSGGAMEIGGSCIYLKIDGKGILFDAGIRQGGSKDPIPDFRTIQHMGGVDAIIVSHAHMDHTGTLPVISKAYPQARIYMTAMTADLVRVLLFDSLKIMERREDEIPHYAQNDVTAMLNRIYPIGYNMPFSIFENMTLTFYPAGHIAGAACIYLEAAEGTVFYSGDFCAFPQKTIEGIRIPKLRPDVAIVETTYGNQLHASRQVEEQRLIELVAQCVRSEYKVLIPAFALGRAQEVILLLKAAIQNGQVPPVPVYVDGMVRDINAMYARNPTYLRSNLGRSILKGNAPFYTKEITAVAPSQDRDELLTQKGAAVFVSSSGMLTGGPSVQYAKKIAAMENGCIIITGYQDEEAPGRQLTALLEGGSGQPPLAREEPGNPAPFVLNLDGAAVPVRCRVERVGLSAHADQSEIQALLDRISPKDIFLVHGDPEVIRQFGHELAGDYRRNIYLPECGSQYEINCRNKRKQLKFQLSHSLMKQVPLSELDEAELWDYMQLHYNEKDLTCAQIAYIWSGQNITDAAQLSGLQARLLSSPRFSPNPRRLFLFHANSREEVEANLSKKALTPQEIEAVIQRIFNDYNYKKISYHLQQEEVLLNFDYPDAVPEADFALRCEAFKLETGWTIAKNPSMNHAAANLLVQMLFGQQLKKISYFADKKTYSITLNPSAAASKGDDSTLEQKKLDFLRQTGWQLYIDGQTPPAVTATQPAPASDMFLPWQEAPVPVEQNFALYCIDQTFEDLPHKVYKKSIKSDHVGKYMELAFISPQIGQRCSPQLEHLAGQIQWRIRISKSVNQMEILKQAQLLCMRYGISLKQNPSYMPSRQTVRLKVHEGSSAETIEELKKAFKELTGLECEITI